MGEYEDLVINTKIDIDYADVRQKVDKLKQIIDDAVGERTVKVKFDADGGEGDGANSGGGNGNPVGTGIDYSDYLKIMTMHLEDIKELVQGLITRPSILPSPVPSPSIYPVPSPIPKQPGSETSGGKTSRKRKSLLDGILDSVGTNLTHILAKFAGFVAFAKAFSAFSSYLQKVLIWNQQFREVMADLKGAVLTLIQPIIEFVVPILIKVIQVLTAIITSLGRMLASAFGKSFAQMTKNAQTLYNTVRNINKTVADYDELNVINRDQTIYPSFDFADQITDEILKLEMVAGLAMLAIGLILVFSGINIPVGLALIVAGAASLADIATQLGEGSIEEQLQTWIDDYGEIITGAALALLVLGVVLLFTGNIPLGIALIIEGAGTLYAESQLNGEALSEVLSTWVEEYGDLIIGGGVALILIGLLVMCTGHIGIGLAMIIAGAGMLYTAVSVNPEAVREIITGLLEEYSDYILITAGILVVLGVLLAATGHFGIGLALIIAGASMMYATVSLKPGAISELLSGEFATTLAIIAGFILVIGVVLTIVGFYAIGIAMIIAGAGLLVAEIVVNWDTIKEKITPALAGLLSIISGFLVVLGVILVLTGGLIALGIGLIYVGVKGIYKAVEMDENPVTKFMKSALAGLKAIASGFEIVLGILLMLTGVGIGLGLALLYRGLKGTTAAMEMDDNPITRFVKNMAQKIIDVINWVIDKINDIGHIQFEGWTVAGKEIIPKIDKQIWNIPHIPALAQGTVVPPNRQFLAMLGDNQEEQEVVSPLSTIKQAIQEQLEESGLLGNNNSAQGQTIVLQLNGKTLAQVVWDENKKMYKQYGAYAPST